MTSSKNIDSSIPSSNENLSFINGLAVYSKQFEMNGYSMSKLGLVDDKFNVVLPCNEMYRKIEILPRNNVLVTFGTPASNGNSNDKFHLVTKVYKYPNGLKNDDGTFIPSNYSLIDDTYVLVKNGPVFSVFDTESCEYTSPWFSGIREFQRMDGLSFDVAMAVKKVSIDYLNFEEISCYIDKSGKIVSGLSFSKKGVEDIIPGPISVEMYDKTEGRIRRELRKKFLSDGRRESEVQKELVKTIRTI